MATAYSVHWFYTVSDLSTPKVWKSGESRESGVFE